MKKIHYLLGILAIALASATFYACKKNASGRNTLSLVDDATVLSLASQEYASFISQNPPITGTPEAAMVQRVGNAVAAGVEQYLAEKGQTNLLEGYQWEFNLVNNPEANAWCMPGGKIVVYTGLLQLTSSEAELAVVMGHEIAHAVLKHGNERMSQQLLAQYGGTALSVLLSSKPQETQQLFATAFGISSTLGVLAFSRTQENESDEAGLYYMAIGGYDPNAAVTFWQKMQANGGANVPVLLSTHPSDEQRIENIKSILPDALKYYNP
jgi:predicted Zn-dependent protease